MLPPWEKLVRLVSGRALAERSEQKRLEREYKDAAAALKLITTVENEPRIEYTSAPPSVYSSPTPEHRKAAQGTLRPPQRPIYERCASSPVVPAFDTQKTPAGPPDITARDLTTEELKRNYSCDNVWHFKEQPLPPMPQMTGFGRYRRAVNAPAQWQMDHLHQTMHDMGSVIVNHLGDCPPAGLDPETWREYRAHHSRTSSIESSRSSGSGAAQTTPMEYFDASTGTRVSRGFCPSTTSSAASSLRDGSVHHRRDSSMSKTSMTSSVSDEDVRHSRRPRRMSPYRHTSMTSMSPLTAISETQEASQIVPRKVEKPCEFEAGGNTESAVASDNDDELDWADLLVVGGGGNASNLTRRLERTSSTANTGLTLAKQRTNSQERPKSRASKRAVPDRSKTIKVVSRPAQRRVRKQSGNLEAVQAAIAHHARKESKRQAGNTTCANSVRSPSEEEDVPVRKQSSEQRGGSSTAHNRMIASIKDQHNISASPSPPQAMDEGVTSLQSDTSHDTLFIGYVSNTMQLPSRGTRERSSTVCRISPAGSSSPLVETDDRGVSKK